MVSWCCCCCCYHCRCCCCINYVHLLSLGAVVCLLPRNYADTGGFSRDPLQAGQLSARLKHHLLHLQHGGPGRGTLPVGGDISSKIYIVRRKCKDMMISSHHCNTNISERDSNTYLNINRI